MYTYTDKILRCSDCGQEFAFSAAEQEFYASRSFTEPRRCSSCRAIRKAARGDSAGSSGGYNGSSSYGTRELFTATCANCGREARVPFRPSGIRPVYCSDCFTSQRG